MALGPCQVAQWVGVLLGTPKGYRFRAPMGGNGSKFLSGIDVSFSLKLIKIYPWVRIKIHTHTHTHTHTLLWSSPHPQSSRAL